MNFFQKRTDQFMKSLKKVLQVLNIMDLKIKLSTEYQFKETFTLEMYKMISVVTRDQTSLDEGCQTVSCHLCPIYFALDAIHADVDLILIGPDQERFYELTKKVS